ncbi:hypothetical protein MNB_SM-6-550 [hydrothermal vent metagenome]|uniref:Inner spore coat protein H n=1 Tax=hydrothermal vent metagenome TaxID=652676 RepID=A0A1W1CFX4_9ZZZZ
MNVKNSFLHSIVCFTVILFISGCGGGSSNSVSKKPSIVGNIQDKAVWYEKNPKSLATIQVTVPVPNDYRCRPFDDLTAPERPCTFIDVYHDTNPYDDYKPKLHVIMTSDDYGISAQASMVQKGRSTRQAKQKGFRITLDKQYPLYNDERTLQLNKHPYDHSRMRNRLFFSIFESVPNFTSLRTRFAHLYMDQEDNGTFVDKGLFTHVEHYDGLFLQNHGFGLSDNLYKAKNFSFQIVPGMEVDAKDKPLNKKAFDQIIEMENGKDRKKLLEMVQAVENTPASNFMNVFNKYFNRENYLTWMAVNIITGNKDTVNQNFYLLNPKYSDTFYFLPWDYDGAAYTYPIDIKWDFGLGRYWEIPLHKKFLLDKKNREDLAKKINFLRTNYFNDTIIHEKVDKYKPIVEPFIKVLPDSHYLNYTDWVNDTAYLRNQAIPYNLQRYQEELGTPMPFWQSVSYKNQNLSIIWDESIDLENDIVDYNLTVAKDMNMSQVVIQEHGLSKESPLITYISDSKALNYQKTISLQPGTYYLKIVSYERNNPKHYQIAFDKDLVFKYENSRYGGILEFRVE